ncbi:MAG: hypothetical protein HXX16_01155 [Bacteroidales bacterium]|nr:hypothetical protein [Bacteroidales bacterium]
MNTVTQFKQRFGSIKTIFFLFVFILTVSTQISAQTRPVQDVRRVIVTTSYVVENGQQKDLNYAVEQQIYDSLNRMHTEIEFDLKDHFPHNYKWHSYNRMERIRTLVFRNEKMTQVLEFSYKNNLVNQEVVKTVQTNDTSILYILNFTYNSSGNPTKVIAKNTQGKEVYSVSSKFDAKGHELSRKVKTKANVCPQDSILGLSSKPVYNTAGLLAADISKTSFANKKSQVIEVRYTYDNKKNLTGITKLDEKGKQISREERTYHSKIEGRIMQIKYFGANNVLIKSIAKRYEIYPVNNIYSRTIED